MAQSGTSAQFAPCNEQNVLILVEKLLLQDQQAKYYQGQLESRIYSDNAAFQRLRVYCVQLEKMASSLESQKSLQETSFRSAAETCQLMARDLSLERARVQELESRLNDLYPTIETFLKGSTVGQSRHCETEVMRELQQENYYQRELITCLQSALQAREETVEELKLSLKETLQAIQGGSGDNTPRQPKVDETYSSDEDGSVEIITNRPPSVIHHRDI
ncbi:uncharacterized protein N7484_007026 [Penicillium longicatenatum]|uniref:uncharacterized protein n=1 Tax=Penicillium longicatenatum TaxID=1561947 RepID=UPI0025498F86|nr:uncharacterized protein N7484_007026 [Penicillium longicatenatum]KAJ5639164.1 hypothetical protein N7484_007026 [Penicillium longicatenatum]